MIFILEKLFQRYMLKSMDPLETILPSEKIIIKELLKLFSRQSKTLWHGSK